MSNLIDRQAAIDFIDAGHLCNPNEPRWSDNEVVNFLKSRPSAQPEVAKDICVPNNDCISRQAAIDAMKSINDSICEQQAIDALCELPSAQPERKEGRWIRKSNWMWTCSCCGKDDAYAYAADDACEPTVLQDFFCPHCGAKIGGNDNVDK